MPGTGEALRVARAIHRLTMRDVGEALGLTSQAVYYYERKGAVPDTMIPKLPRKVRGAVVVAAIEGHEAAIAALRKLTK